MLDNSLRYLLVMLAYLSLSQNAFADCIDIPNIEDELIPAYTTIGNVQISFEYNIEKSEYTLSWDNTIRHGGPFGPFPMTMSCGIPSLKWENNDFVIFDRGCGTFCWYVKIFSLGTAQTHSVPEYQQIERPLAFDTKRNLLAYYHSQDEIHIKNLLSGYEQILKTAYECEYYSGLCFKDVGFSNDKLEYTWILNPTDEKLSHPLEQALLE